MTRGLLVCLLLSVVLSAAHAAAPPRQWLPQDSWPGAKQYDARLEKTVKFWGTGVPAAELFASITKQTGVALGFDPPDDDNARICLNVYLNPKEPPTLREVLVQIGWVMDCAWAVEGQGGMRRYVLLHTDIGNNLLKELAAETVATWWERSGESGAARQEGSTVARAKLQEIGDALDLSREEVIRRYKGKDNLMLLALLDPARRAFARLCLTLAEREAEPFWGATLAWDDLPADLRALARETFEASLANTARMVREGAFMPGDLEERGWDTGYRWDDWDWVERECLRGASISIGVHMGFLLNVEGQPGRPQVPGVFLLLYRDPRDRSSMDQDIGSELYRLLGEPVPEENDPERKERGALREYRERQQRTLVEKQLAKLVHLSPAAAERLSSIKLPTTADEPHALWQLQEAVAVQSGMHVVSDAFWQPPQSAKPILDLLFPGQPQSPNALVLLRAACVATETRDRLLFGLMDPLPRLTRWEWGDAGDFLRFRSADRDAWRAAFLPAGAVHTLHDWLAPRLPDDLAKAKQAVVPLGVRHCGAFLRPLTYLQRRWGGVLTYDDPADEGEQWQAGFRQVALAALRAGARLYVWLSALDDDQWEQVQAAGLQIGTDVALEPDPEDPFRFEEPPPAGTTLRLCPVIGEERHGALTIQPGSGWRAVELIPPGAKPRRPERYFVATKVTARPDHLPHLVPLPEEYAQ